MFRNLIFDWSGTLVDDLGPVIEATNVVLGKYAVAALDREGFRRTFRLPYREFYAELLPNVPLEELEAHFRLDWCAQSGIRCFVLTSMDPDAFQRQMDGFGLRGHFEATYAGVLDKRDVIHQILATHHLLPAETAFVGDMTHDVETARHGGISSIAVLTGYNHAEILAAVRPDITVPDLGVLRTLLDRSPVSTRPVATVGALIHDGAGNVLMVRTHKWSNHWGIPGGKIERGETSTDALRREILEETGLELAEVEFAIVQDCIDSPEFQRLEHFILLNFVARATTTAVTLNHEAQEFRWLPVNDALALNLNQPTRVLLDHVVESGKL